MTAGTTKGIVLAYEVESTYGTDPGGTPKHIRPEGPVVIANPVNMGIPVDTRTAEAYGGQAPVTVAAWKDSAYTFSMLLRRAASAGSDSAAVTFLEAMGCTVVDEDNDVVSGVPTTTAIDFTGSNGALGVFTCIELDNGLYWPALCADMTGTTFTPTMALPSATSATKVTKKTNTFTPGAPGPVTGKSLYCTAYTHAKDGGSDVIVNSGGCHVSSISSVTFERGSLPKIDFTIRAASHANSTGTLPANSFADSEPVKAIDDNFTVGFAAASSSGAIARANIEVSRAVFTLGCDSGEIVGFGSSDTVGGIQGSIGRPTDEGPMIEMDVITTVDKWDDWDGANTARYIEIVQPSTDILDPCVIAVLPNAKIIEEPTFVQEGDYYKTTVKYRGYPAGYDSATLETQGNQAAYLGIMDSSS